MSETIVQNSQYVKTLVGDCDCVIDEPAFVFPFEPDHFQRHAFKCISRDEHVLVLAHTGSGKTVPAIYAIANYIKKGKKVVYTAPIKALSNQKYKEFGELFEQLSVQLGREVTVGLMTGDNKIKPDADCVIMTTEILRNELFNIGEQDGMKKEELFEDDFISQIGCVIFDEVHYINDKDRGHVWEETIILLDPSVTLVMLSATVNKPEKFAKWIGDIKKRPVNMLPTTHRVVPLEHFVFLDDTLHTLQDVRGNFCDQTYSTTLSRYKSLRDGGGRKRRSNQYLINELIDYLSLENMLQTIFFTFSKKNCEKFAKSVTTHLITPEVSCEIEKIFDKYLHPYEEKYKNISQYHTIKALAMKGVGFHHSGLLFILKEVVEILFQQGYIKVLFATETFAVGVNYPTRTVVFTSIEKYSNEGMCLLQTSEYKQMAGRAGRRGLDKKGNVILLPLYDFPARCELKSVMMGEMPLIRSKFEVTYSFLLQINQSKTSTVDSFVGQSLFQIDNDSQLETYHKDIRCLEDELVTMGELDEETKQHFEEYDKFQEKEAEMKRMGLSLNKKQLKEKAKHLKKINGGVGAHAYERYQAQNNVKHRLRNTQMQEQNMKIYIKVEGDKMVSVLRRIGYMHTDSALPTIKGIIASQINECNELILTEMITSRLFDKLEPVEICAVLSIFIGDVKHSDAITMNNIKLQNSNVMNALVCVNKIIDNFVGVERECNVAVHMSDYYNVYYNYVDVVYHWASGCDIGVVFDLVDTYAGNFIKNMLKVNNIVNDVISLSKVYGNIEVIPNLECINEMLIRGIVTANSLYI